MNKYIKFIFKKNIKLQYLKLKKNNFINNF